MVKVRLVPPSLGPKLSAGASAGAAAGTSVAAGAAGAAVAAGAELLCTAGSVGWVYPLLREYYTKMISNIPLLRHLPQRW